MWECSLWNKCVWETDNKKAQKYPKSLLTGIARHTSAVPYSQACQCEKCVYDHMYTKTSQVFSMQFKRNTLNATQSYLLIFLPVPGWEPSGVFLALGGHRRLCCVIPTEWVVCLSCHVRRKKTSRNLLRRDQRLLCRPFCKTTRPLLICSEQTELWTSGATRISWPRSCAFLLP